MPNDAGSQQVLITNQTVGDDTILMTVTGEITPLDASDFADAVTAIAEPPTRRYVIDLTHAQIRDADVLASLYELARRVRQRDGLVALVTAPRAELRRILHTTGLETAFTSYDSRRAALSDLGLADPN
jgi:anti-anti-sigma factor